MTRRKGKTEATDVEGLLGQDEAFIRTIVKTALQEVLEAEMVEAVGAGCPRLKAVQGERTASRLGDRRLHILLRRQGIALNHKKLFRLYREERLTLRRRGGRKRALGTRTPMAVPQGPNQRWSLDFAADALVDSRRFRILAVVDDFSREWLALLADTSLSGVRVARELDRLVEFRGAPLRVVSDNGTETGGGKTLCLTCCQTKTASGILPRSRHHRLQRPLRAAGAWIARRGKPVLQEQNENAAL